MKVITPALIALTAFTISSLLMALFVKYTWDNGIAAVLKLPHITYLQAFSLYIFMNCFKYAPIASTSNKK